MSEPSPAKLSTLHSGEHVEDILTRCDLILSSETSACAQRRELRKHLNRRTLLALAKVFKMEHETGLLRRSANVLRIARSKVITKTLLADYFHVNTEKKEIIMYVLASLGDFRCVKVFSSEWLNVDLNRFSRCDAYEALAGLYARRKRKECLIRLIIEGLKQEPHLQLAALAVSSLLSKVSFPEFLVDIMASNSVIFAEVSTREPNWLFEKIVSRHRPL